MPPCALPRAVVLKVPMVIVWDDHFRSHLVELGTQVGWGCEVLMGLGGGACQDFLNA